jgi:hypothetical protein
MTVRSPSWQSWVLAGSMGLLTAVGGYAFNAIDQRMSVSESRLMSVEADTQKHAERLSTLEAESRANEKRLKEINDKLDLLIRMHLTTK